MAIIRYTQPSAKDGPPPDRRGYDEVLDLRDRNGNLIRSSSSPRGSTYWKRLRRCPREHALHHGGLRKAYAMSEHLVVGLLVHRALEHYYLAIKASQDGLGFPPEQQAWLSIKNFATEPGYEETWKLVQRMLAGYFERYRDSDAKWKIWAVEETVSYLDGTLEWTGRLDGLIERDGALWILEHKCQPAGTRVELDGGKSILIEEMVGRTWRVCAYDADARKPVVAQATCAPNGVREIWRLGLSDGRSLRATENHPVLTARGWVPLAALERGDWVASPLLLSREGGKAGPPEGESLAALVGLFVGDGTVSGATMRFTKKPGPTLDYARELLRARGWLGTYERVDERSGAVTLSSLVGFRDEIDRLGLRDCRAAEKFLPRELLEGTLYQRYALLGALWSTDGSVSVHDERRNGVKVATKVQIVYTTRSEQLGRDVQELLSRGGLVSTLRSSSVMYKGARRPYWQVKIVGRASKRNFLLGLAAGHIHAPKYSQEHLAVALEALDGVASDDPIPLAWIGAEGVAALRAAGVRVRPEHGQTAVEAWQFAERGLSIPAPDLRWAQVETCLVDGREMTYALTVPGPSSYVSDGIYTHNTAKAITGDLLGGYQMDMQMLGYVWLFQHVIDASKLPPLAGIIVNLLTKHATPRYERVEVCPSRYHLAEFEKSQREWIRVREESFAKLGWPKALGNCTGASRYFTTCDYFDLCHGQPDVPLERLLKEELPYGFTRIDLDALDPDEVA